MGILAFFYQFSILPSKAAEYKGNDPQELRQGGPDSYKIVVYFHTLEMKILLQLFTMHGTRIWMHLVWTSFEGLTIQI